MTIIRALLLISCVIMISAATPVFANAGENGRQSEASQLYDQGDYGSAYKKYMKDGKEGDTFSRYRISYMYLKGQGTKTDIVESLAWAVLAAEEGGEELSSYRDAVAALVPEKKRKKAASKAGYYIRKWGNKEATRERNTDRGCTSSRIKSSCGNATSSSSVWIAWPKEVANEQEMQETIEGLNDRIAAGPAPEDTGNSSQG